MLIYAVDDEPLALRALTRSITEAEPNCRVREFTWGQPMLDEMTRLDEKPDAIFLDIEMPGLSGVELAKRVKQLSPRTWIVFVTGFSEYAVDAFAIHAKGYVMKPVTPEAIRAELETPAPSPLSRAGEAHVKIKTFGNFEIFVDGKPLEFARSKAKEMLAYLVHRGGAVCTTQEVAAVLFEDEADGRLDYFFKIAQCMKRTLAKAGCGDILRHSYKSYAIEPSLVECDYYHFLSDTRPEALNAYTGEYMAQYSWAEFTGSYLSDKSDLAGGAYSASQPASL